MNVARTIGVAAGGALGVALPLAAYGGTALGLGKAGIVSDSKTSLSSRDMLLGGVASAAVAGGVGLTLAFASRGRGSAFATGMAAAAPATALFVGGGGAATAVMGAGFLSLGGS